MTIKNDQPLEFKHIFGPVPSRRLGISLGVDLVPHKTCSLNCVYCECGKTTNLTITKKEYVCIKSVQDELNTFLSKKPELDYITFSGSGEPTLNIGIGKIISFLKSNFPEYRIALLTNGTLFCQNGFSNNMLDIDVLKISLDAASQKIFQLINRPHKDLIVSDIIDSLVKIRKRYSNELSIEIFIVPGINDNEVELKKIKKALDRIEPDKVQLNTLDRPGTETWVCSMEEKKISEIASYLYDAEVIKHFNSKFNVNRFSENSYSKNLLHALRRRPCTKEDILRITGIDTKEIRKYLNLLIEKGKIEEKKMQRGVFYVLKA